MISHTYLQVRAHSKSQTAAWLCSRHKTPSGRETIHSQNWSGVFFFFGMFLRVIISVFWSHFFLTFFFSGFLCVCCLLKKPHRFSIFLVATAGSIQITSVRKVVQMIVPEEHLPWFSVTVLGSEVRTSSGSSSIPWWRLINEVLGDYPGITVCRVGM